MDSDQHADPPSPARILIADDEESIVNTISRVLAAEGAGIETVTNGEAAIALIDSRDFDVVISDIMMPGASGIAVLKHAKMRNPETEVILMTGFASIGTAAEAVRQGASDYLVKPFANLEILKMALRRALSRRQLVRQVRMYGEWLDRTNREMEIQKEKYENLAEVAHICVSRTVQSVERMAAELGASAPEAVKKLMADILEDNAEMKTLAETFLETRRSESPRVEPGNG